MPDRPDTVAAVDADDLEQEALAAAADATSLAALDEVRVRYLGRSSALKLALRNVRDRETGMTLNAVRETVESALAAREDQLARAQLEERLATEHLDVTLPAELVGPPKLRPRGTLHPTTLIRRDVEDAFIGLGYEIREDQEIETVEYNFDKLAFPAWHPARSPRDTFYLDATHLLRTETSPSQIYALEEKPPPVYMVSIGRVYRRDAITPTRFPIFHQFEGLAIDRGITMADLKGTLLHVMRALFGQEREVRFRTHYFPFTEPSMEPDVSCGVCGGVGCLTCKHSGWIELGGSGMVDPQVLLNVGLDPDEWGGFAFGLGLERAAQLRYDIPTIRPFWEDDLRFLRQFR
jgi:phenylalanyl-tRNA synthetase alpha chain